MITFDDFSKMAASKLKEWNGDPSHPKVHIALCSPGASVVIPGNGPIIFSSAGTAVAGMQAETLTGEQVILLNETLKLESIISTFFHEFGHLVYRHTHRTNFDEIESEASAISYSLQALEEAGLEEIAYQEAANITEMTTGQIYRAAVEKLENNPLWRKYSDPNS